MRSLVSAIALLLVLGLSAPVLAGGAARRRVVGIPQGGGLRDGASARRSGQCQSAEQSGLHVRCRPGRAAGLCAGGQRQRIAIARALYHEPEVLVLDEATSALDAATEAEINRAVKALSGEKTVIVVAHRVTTVRDLDRLYLLDGGRLVAAGSFATLEHENEDFRRVVLGAA